MPARLLVRGRLDATVQTAQFPLPQESLELLTLRIGQLAIFDPRLIPFSNATYVGAPFTAFQCQQSGSRQAGV